MELNEYQKQAMTTRMSSCDNFSYMMLNLVGEVGEFASKAAKAIRKDDAVINGNEYWTTEALEPLMLEAGDILWQLAGLCDTFGWTLEQVAEANLAKLASRKERGVIDGNGDYR